jgi:hypothetical protein
VPHFKWGRKLLWLLLSQIIEFESRKFAAAPREIIQIFLLEKRDFPEYKGIGQKNCDIRAIGRIHRLFFSALKEEGAEFRVCFAKLYFF